MKRNGLRLLIIWLVMGLFLTGSPAAAQADPDACPALVEAALQAIDAACTDLGRGEACYGHTRVEVTPWDEASV